MLIILKVGFPLSVPATHCDEPFILYHVVPFPSVCFATNLILVPFFNVATLLYDVPGPLRLVNVLDVTSTSILTGVAWFLLVATVLFSRTLKFDLPLLDPDTHCVEPFILYHVVPFASFDFETNEIVVPFDKVPTLLYEIPGPLRLVNVATVTLTDISTAVSL